MIKTNSLKRILNYTPFLSVLPSRCDSAGLIQQIQNNFLGSLDKGIESLSQTFIFQSLYLCSPMSWTLVILNYYELLDQKKCQQQINTLGLLHLKPLLIHPIFFPNPFISHFKMLFQMIDRCNSVFPELFSGSNPSPPTWSQVQNPVLTWSMNILLSLEKSKKLIFVSE